MTFTVTLQWWMIPTIVTVAVVIIAGLISRKEKGMFAGMGGALFLVPGLAVSMVCWIIAGFLK